MITETRYIDCDVLKKITRQSLPAATAGACIQAERDEKEAATAGRDDGCLDGWMDGWMSGWMVDKT